MMTEDVDVDLQYLRHVVQCLEGLVLHTLQHLSRVRAEADLTGDVENIVHSDCLVVRPYGSRGSGAAINDPAVRGSRLTSTDILGNSQAGIAGEEREEGENKLRIHHK